MRIMIFLQGTAIMHRGALPFSREERVRQAVEGKDESIHDFASYVPVGDVVRKLQGWRAQGAEIVYLSSHRKAEDVEKDKFVLRKHGFPGDQIFYRQSGETYADIAERVMPGVLIEDDCESIGGEVEMTYPHIRQDFKPRIKSIVIREFGGIDYLPDDVHALTNL
jgi:hypothetical protein